jgi:hypothetical protein
MVRKWYKGRLGPDHDLDWVRRQLRRMADVRTAMGLNDDEERHYDALCRREQELMRAEREVDLRERVVALHPEQPARNP